MLSSLALAAIAAFAGPSAATTSVSAPLSSVADLPKTATAVSLRTEDKIVLKGSFYAPKVSKKKSTPAPAALLLHDASKSREELEELAAYLHKRGFAVLTLDLRGHGDSATEKAAFEKWDEKERETNWSLSSRDVDAAAEFLLEQDGVHTTNLSIVGFGAASALAVRRAMVDENVRALVMVDPDPKSYGYNLVNGVSELEGLPTLVMSSMKQKEVARRLQDAAHEANAGLEYVEIKTLKAEPDKMLKDKRLRQGMAGWLKDQVMPKK